MRLESNYKLKTNWKLIASRNTDCYLLHT